MDLDHDTKCNTFTPIGVSVTHRNINCFAYPDEDEEHNILGNIKIDRTLLPEWRLASVFAPHNSFPTALATAAALTTVKTN